MTIDFNVHLPPEGDFAQERDLGLFDPVASLEQTASRLIETGVTTANVMVLDTDLLRRDPQRLLGAIRQLGYRSTFMIDPRDDDAETLVDRAADLGVSGIKFHPYFLRLEEPDYGLAVRLAKRAEMHGLWIAVCNSYGTIDVLRIEPVKLLIAICREVRMVPVVSLHAGGARVLDVMSVAFDCDNLLLETSFSLPFWNESSVEQDFAFAMRKLGPGRWLYGSDHPHVDLAVAQDEMRAFLDRHRFSAAEADRVLSGTAASRLFR